MHKGTKPNMKNFWNNKILLIFHLINVSLKWWNYNLQLKMLFININNKVNHFYLQCHMFEPHLMLKKHFNKLFVKTIEYLLSLLLSLSWFHGLWLEKKIKDFPDTKTRTFSHCNWQFPQDIWPEMKNMNLEKLICITGVSLWFVSEGEQIVTWSQHQLLRSTLSL